MHHTTSRPGWPRAAALPTPCLLAALCLLLALAPAVHAAARCTDYSDCCADARSKCAPPLNPEKPNSQPDVMGALKSVAEGFGSALGAIMEGPPGPGTFLSKCRLGAAGRLYQRMHPSRMRAAARAAPPPAGGSCP